MIARVLDVEAVNQGCGAQDMVPVVDGVGWARVGCEANTAGEKIYAERQRQRDTN
jgi:hypothetical protein